jgi:hypothetical protein
MKRDSTTIWIESQNALTALPWVNNAPDFTGITDPTLSVLKSAYEADKGNILIIPDVIPAPATAPDWEGFKNHLDTANIYEQMLAVDFSVATDAFQAISFILGGIEVVDNIRQINIFYQVFVQKSPAELVKTLNEAIARFNIPINI